MSETSLCLSLQFIEKDLPEIAQKFNVDVTMLLSLLVKLGVVAAKTDDWSVEDHDVTAVFGLFWGPLFSELERRGFVGLKHEHIWTLDGFANA